MLPPSTTVSSPSGADSSLSTLTASLSIISLPARRSAPTASRNESQAAPLLNPSPIPPLPPSHPPLGLGLVNPGLPPGSLPPLPPLPPPPRLPPGYLPLPPLDPKVDPPFEPLSNPPPGSLLSPLLGSPNPPLNPLKLEDPLLAEVLPPRLLIPPLLAPSHATLDCGIPCLFDFKTPPIIVALGFPRLLKTPARIWPMPLWSKNGSAASPPSSC